MILEENTERKKIWKFTSCPSLDWFDYLHHLNLSIGSIISIIVDLNFLATVTDVLPQINWGVLFSVPYLGTSAKYYSMYNTIYYINIKYRMSIIVCIILLYYINIKAYPPTLSTYLLFPFYIIILHNLFVI